MNWWMNKGVCDVRFHTSTVDIRHRQGKPPPHFIHFTPLIFISKIHLNAKKKKESCKYTEQPGCWLVNSLYSYSWHGLGQTTADTSVYKSRLHSARSLSHQDHSHKQQPSNISAAMKMVRKSRKCTRGWPLQLTERHCFTFYCFLIEHC